MPKGGILTQTSIFDSDQHYLGQVGDKTFYGYLAQHRHGPQDASVPFDGHRARHYDRCGEPTVLGQVTAACPVLIASAALDGPGQNGVEDTRHEIGGG